MARLNESRWNQLNILGGFAMDGVKADGKEIGNRIQKRRSSCNNDRILFVKEGNDRKRRGSNGK